MASPYYAGAVWPPHVHREYPKWVNGVLVEGAEAEAELLAAPPVAAAPTSVTPSADMAALLAQLAEANAKLAAMTLDADGVDERAELIGQCMAHGLEIDRKASVEELRAALAAA